MSRDIAPRVVVRPATAADALAVRRLQAVAALASFPVTGDAESAVGVARDAAAWTEPAALGEFARWFESVVGDPEHGWWVAEAGAVGDDRFLDDRGSGAGHDAGPPDAPTTVVGFLHGSRPPHGLRLQGLYVDPGWWGGSVAGRLMDEFDAWADGEAAAVVVLAHNGRAIRFYEKRGFARDAPGSCAIPDVVTLSRPAKS